MQKEKSNTNKGVDVNQVKTEELITHMITQIINDKELKETAKTIHENKLKIKEDIENGIKKFMDNPNADKMAREKIGKPLSEIKAASENIAPILDAIFQIAEDISTRKI